jgi:hypothetical protein
VQNPPLDFLCSLAAGFSEFKKTPQEREAAKDSRRSLAERYTSREDYVAKVRAASLALEKKGFLLPQDTADIVRDDELATELFGK